MATCEDAGGSRDLDEYRVTWPEAASKPDVLDRITTKLRNDIALDPTPL